jgi:hypothetical protein
MVAGDDKTAAGEGQIRPLALKNAGSWPIFVGGRGTKGGKSFYCLETPY